MWSRKVEWLLAGSLTVSLTGSLAVPSGHAEEAIHSSGQNSGAPIVTTVEVLKQATTSGATAAALQQTTPATPAELI